MQIYLVGGAVRDLLLGYPVKDKDWLVTGATPDQLLDLGYKQVGKSFPVFLHPKNQQEYALARTEKKQGIGYTGFVCDFSPEITIEQDLKRRDLTVNAMAQAENGDIIDPFGGQQDLDNRILRHVSDAFSEDPLRVLRVAKFAARYAHLNFTVADETLELMQQIAETDELQSLTPERVWQETQAALECESPQVYFDVLYKTSALKKLMPELHKLWGVPNPPKWHPEIDSGIHTLMVVEQAVRLSNDLTVRFAALLHDLGKALTPPEKWPSHHGHEKSGLEKVKEFCTRLKVPNDCRDLALLTCEFHTHCHKAYELKPSTILKLFDSLDVWRKPERFQQFLLACKADARGRTGFEDIDYKQADYLADLAKKTSDVNVQDIIKLGFKGAEIKAQLNQKRLDVLQEHSLQEKQQVTK